MCPHLSFTPLTPAASSQGHLFVHHSLAHVNRELIVRLLEKPAVRVYRYPRCLTGSWSKVDLRVERVDRRGRFSVPELRRVPNLGGACGSPLNPA
jgi:hypothetical protein